MNRSTIVYYSSNKEKPDLEAKVIENIKNVAGKTPIISVTHKKTDLGRNVYIGNIGCSNHNIYRQIQMGAMLAKTDFIITAEADCFYPKSYFEHVPPEVNRCWKHNNNYILNEWGAGEYKGFYPKDVGTFAMIVGREYLIKEIDEVLAGRPVFDLPRKEKPLELFRYKRWKLFDSGDPVLSIKTYDGMRKHTQTYGEPIDEVPIWGNADVLRDYLFNGEPRPYGWRQK